jgi:signal transduction histidine kinase
VKITLPAASMVDRIVLVPCLWRNPDGRLAADSFPLDFKIVGGSESATEGVLLAERINQRDHYLPRIAPLTIDIDPIRLSWVRIEAEILSPRIWDNNPCLHIDQPYRDGFGDQFYSRIGFAEIEVISGGTNVAKNKTAYPNFKVDNSARASSALTDGYNYYGDILPVRDWLQELALRHQLENELPRLEDEVKQRYALQQKNFQRLIWVALTLILAIVVLFLIQRINRQRAIFRTREQIAADLHDELGANLHALTLLSEITNKTLSCSVSTVEKVAQISLVRASKTAKT